MQSLELLLIYLRIFSQQVAAIIATCIVWIPITYLAFRLLCFWIRHRASGQLPHLRNVVDGQRPLVIGFFHPYCNAGGGGERVLWMAVQALQTRYKHVRCVIYTGDVDASREEILERARQRFNISLPRHGPDEIHFAFLHRRMWVEASSYPFFTLLGQSLGSLVLGWEALLMCIPDIYFDSMGYAFTLPLFRYVGGCRTACYVHYPTISTDMLDRVVRRHADYNNSSRVSNSVVLSQLKLVYYRLFAWAYGVAGRRSDLILVNSSWTESHILGLWKAPERTFIVYPPCDVAEFLTIPLDKRLLDDSRIRKVVSVSQFRPEKNHRLQLEAFKKFLASVPSERQSLFILILVGGCRNEDDTARVGQLKKYAEELKIADNVEFRLNVTFSDLKNCLMEADIGLHTMWNEHFGIGVVECMAAGTIVLAHDSGGPKLDIVVDHNGQKTGFLASDSESFAACLNTIFSLDAETLTNIRQNARESVKRFSDTRFSHTFLSVTDHLLSSVY